MELQWESVEQVTSVTLPREQTVIIPIGDIQVQPPNNGRDVVDWDRLQRLVDWGVEHNAYWIGMGDYVDFGSPSNRGKLKALLAEGHLYDSAEAAIEAVAEEQLQPLMDILGPTKGRWLGLLEGHHYWPFADGTTSDTRLAQFLGTRFLGTCAMVQLRFPYMGGTPETATGGGKAKDGRNSRVRPAEVTLWAHHGRGGGKLLSGPLNQLEHVVKGFDADVYLIGHHHRALAGKMDRLYAEFGPKGMVSRLRNRTLVLAATGSFMKGYVEGGIKNNRPGGTYVEQAYMNPTALGAVRLICTPVLSEGKLRVDLDVLV